MRDLSMRSVIVMPMYDPDGHMFSLLTSIIPTLEEAFDGAFISITPQTQSRQSVYIERLTGNPFFRIVEISEGLLVGKQFYRLYEGAAKACSPDQVMHLCFIDRVAFALSGEYRDQFIQDMKQVRLEETPLIFHRSARAWETHPANYRELELMVSRVGEFLFGRHLDFCWCHMAIRAGDLLSVLPQIQASDLSMAAELVLRIRGRARTKEVDWLAWEDPFIVSRDERSLRMEREESTGETLKRLSYVVPMLRLLYEEGSKLAERRGG
jgi:hypothetical protein